MSDLYSEILKVSIEELYQDEYYSIPLTKHQITTVMDLLHENGETSLLEKILIFLNEEYGIKYFPSYEKKYDI